MQHRFLNALERKNVGRPPLWIMRQAGRYLPEYRNLRAKYSFETLSHVPELIAEATKSPFVRFPFDAAILFSDILLITEALKKVFHFHEQKGPVLNEPLQTRRDLEELPHADLTALKCVVEGIRLLKKDLNVPLIGFCGGPFTVASYLIEGGTSKTLGKTKRWLYQDPEGFHLLIERLTQLSIDYLKMQIDAGVQAVQIFDSWAHVLAEPELMQVVIPSLKKIVHAIKDQVPVILFARGCCLFANALAKTGAHCISLDFTGRVDLIRKEIGTEIALQGNLDPDLLVASPERTFIRAKEMVNSMRADPGYIFNLGHGILPETPLESVEKLVEAVHG